MRNIIVVSFTDPSKAYQALSAVKQLDEDGRLSLHSAAVVERKSSAEAIVRDYTDRMPLTPGPRGLVGRMIDGLNGFDESVAIADRIPAGSTGLMGEIGEYAVEVIDSAMGQLGGSVYRESTDAVKAQFKTAEQTRRAAEKEAERAERERFRQERESEYAKWQNERIERAEQRLKRLETWLEGQKRPMPAMAESAAQEAGSTPA
jgi:hypothetical protein